MTTIKATCPTCGDVDLTPRQVSVTTAPAAHWSHYAFCCPTCGEQIVKDADADVVALLRGAGVAVRSIEVPAEALEAHPSSRLTYDDLLDFALLLGRTDALADLVLAEARH
jgi:hypothetical protein